MKESLFFNFGRKISHRPRIFVRRKAETYIFSICVTTDLDKAFIVADKAIVNSYVSKLKKVLEKKVPTFLLTFEATERSKNLKSLYYLVERVVSKEVTERSVIIAVGGGIVGNISGMLAGLLYRGIRLIHVPTTLLAQVDSAADVKQSVNSCIKKNAIGIYYPPTDVVIDIDVLKTLPAREIRSGLAESIKHALSQDSDFLEFICTKVNLKKVDLGVLERIIIKTLSLKIKHWRETPLMWNDVPGQKPERLTHLGHTTGKVIEVLQRDKITHGEAISHGMIIEALCSYKMGIGDKEIIHRMKNIFEKFRLLYPLNKSVNAPAIIKHLYGTSRKQHSPLFALLKNIANPDTISTTIPSEIMEKSLLEYGL